MTTERRVAVAVAVLTVAGALAGVVLSPRYPGRWVLAAVAAGAVLYFLAQALLHRLHARALGQAAGQLGWTVLENEQAQADEPLFTGLSRGVDPENFRRRMGGGFPAIIGRCEGMVAVVRLPRAYDLGYGPEASAALAAHLGSPEGTRLAVYCQAKLRGFTVVPRAVLRGREHGKEASTGDPEFDRLFAVFGSKPDELQAVLTGPVRTALVAADRPFRSLEVGRYGAALYELGKILRSSDLVRRVKLLGVVAGRLRELAGEAR